ncbi:PadR family transcriptional regulator [Butyrivibrio sp. INlla14]|uniref:PadR family transcriptional regulator n=1 Tax=Butyrivibrio sp. INlla14 TaxID=1520808 RepID=UPI000876041C|nr:helix-turn-helix transcriptional regulator [Butyrivibrio sp. INlla14]SCX97652.1 PadR family transcriptional regulator, regulatory protein PadR [Butyrivibrio sp. INlla14]
MIEISSDVIRGYNDTMILFILLDEPSYGYEISKRIRALSEDKYIIKETTLYSAFTRMEKNGYVESYAQSAENGKKRTYYRITELGKQYYMEKCAEWNLTKEVVEKFIRGDK